MIMAVSCTGSGYYVYGSVNVPITESNKTVCARLFSTDTATLQTFFNAVNTTTGVGYQLGIRNGLLTLWSYGGVVVLTAALAANTWFHFTYTREGNVHTFYIDGVPVASATNAAQSGAVSALQICGNQWNENFIGQLEDMRLYGRVLSINEIASLGTTSSESNVYDLRCHWPMLEEAKGVIVDQLFEVYGKVSSFVGTKATGQSGHGFGSRLRGI